MRAQVSAEEFFGTLVPGHLGTLELPRAERATYVFRLFGATASEWSIDLGTREVRRGGLPEPDLYVEMEHRDFEALLDGALDIHGAVVGGRVRFKGDIRLLTHLGRLLQSQPN